MNMIFFSGNQSRPALSIVEEPTMDGQRFLTHTFQMAPGAMKIMMGQITTARTTSVYHQ